ncbi:DNA replication and repair protein RecF [Haloferula luteola]|uniref:DNA replication and repair protein RecF n=2 Tax=Haloferula luteola TaxID=595692 RepID=A0A840VCI1_9BACT|nr:DNA replication and repair protein RecF [Haloferula luteola]
MDFRCFPTLGLEVPEGGAVFTGQNAQGKTSVLEAVCVLVRLHSPRSSRMQTLARIGGSGGFGIAGEAWGMERRIDWRPRQATRHSVEGESRASQGGYLEDGGLLVWMGNDDLDLVRAGGESRRRYLDFMGSQVAADYRRSLARYRRALKAKNLLLKEGDRRRAEIASYEAILIPAAAVLRRVRAELSERLADAVADRQREIAGREELAGIRYEAAGGMEMGLALEQVREKEFRQRRSLVGPHRDELELTLNGLPAAAYASEGQQRTLALALKLAQGGVLRAQTGQEPVWLIDDVFGELDVSRRNALMRALPASAQKWITTTHLDWLEEAPELTGLARFAVEGGHICR